MKRCDRCWYSGRGHYQPVEGFSLCPKCYELWTVVRAEAYKKFRLSYIVEDVLDYVQDRTKELEQMIKEREVEIKMFQKEIKYLTNRNNVKGEKK